MTADLYAAWEAFVQRHEVLPDVPPWIADSWERCRVLLTPHQPMRLQRLRENHLLTAQVSHFGLLSVARPIMEDIYQFIERSQTNVLLVNSAGYVLDAVGDTGVVSEGVRPEALRGISLAEAEIGTNAFGLSLIERVPISVRGAEHFRLAFHRFADAAAPVFDISGKLLGALGVLTSVQNYHPHALGLCVAGARAIEAQRQSDQLLAEQNAHLARLNAILDNIAEGILVWNAEGVILHANPAATRLLDINRAQLMGDPLEAHLRLPEFVQQAVEAHRPLDDVEAELLAAGKPLTCILSLRFVQAQNQTRAVIAILRALSSVRRLVQQQTSGQTGFTFTDLLGKSGSMQRVRHLAETAAAASGPALLSGEAGTGKNLLARAIHHHSPRRDGPFLVYACKTVPAELTLAELLGYAQGFFENRPEGRPSKFELAEGGSLYFQNVDALPIEAQNALLNYLELGIVQRLGSQRPHHVDVRILASSATPLEKRVAEGSFLPDLYYRLSAFEIRLPPLRERAEDLPGLVQQILHRLERQYKTAFNLHPEALALLERYPWPGNVRELETVLTRAIMQASPQSYILPEHLPAALRHGVPQGAAGLPAGAEVASLKQVEREAILRAAQACRGNVTRMARMLGIGRTTVWRRVREYGIPLEKFRQGEHPPQGKRST